VAHKVGVEVGQAQSCLLERFAPAFETSLSTCEMKRGALATPRNLGAAGFTRKRSSSRLAMPKPPAHLCVASATARGHAAAM
jgi:hypothetical protein